MCLYLNSFLSCSIATKRFTKVSYLLYWTHQPQGLSSLPRAAVVAGCKIFFKISNSNVLEFYLFINARMVWRTAKTCVANYNWWWVYYQNIVTLTCNYFRLEAPMLYYIVTAPIRSNWWTVWSEAYFYTDLWFPLQLAVPRHTGRRGWCRCVWLYTTVRLCDVPRSCLSSHVGHVM